MLATAGPLPEGEGWSYELKWDGVRALALVEGAGARLVSRSGRDLTQAYPSLATGVERSGAGRAGPVVVDGEVCALDEAGRPSFQALQNATASGRSPGGVGGLAYLVFDVLRIGDRWLFAEPYGERRGALEGLGLDGPGWSVPDVFGPPGGDVLDASRAAGLEGVVAKRRDSPYLPGRRSTAWVKVKHLRTQEVVIGGFTRGEGHRAAQFGALLLGIPSADRLAYVGKVGTGFDEAALQMLTRRLEALETGVSPFEAPLPGARASGAHFVNPVLVGEVRFAEWTGAGHLRQPTWRGLREDKLAREVVREP
ncbi:MAG: non-homologous end-joining DNA ligase [Actinomycetota bacterium]|nr:non-homologous end-joining DNA ligase [Actinomycetota bacterium]